MSDKDLSVKIFELNQQLRTARLDLDVEQLFDMLFLSTLLPEEKWVAPPEGVPPGGQPGNHGPISVGPGGNHPGGSNPPQNKNKSQIKTIAAIAHKNQKKADGRLTKEEQENNSLRVSRFRVAGVPALSNHASLASTFKHFQIFRSGYSDQVDEQATVDYYADTGLILPIRRQGYENKYDAVIVLDYRAPMLIWQKTATELKRLLEHQGAFREVILYKLFASDSVSELNLVTWEGVGVRGVEKSTDTIVDYSGNRVVFLLSDGVASIWKDGRINRVIKKWGQSMPVTLVQVMGEEHWHRTSHRAPKTLIYAAEPGVPNSKLISAQSSGMALPVIMLYPRSVDRWARMLMKGQGKVKALTINDEKIYQVDKIQSTQQNSEFKIEERYSMLSSTAQRLACCLAVVPLYPDVIRVVQHLMLPNSRIEHFAEIVLCGIISSPNVSSQALLNIQEHEILYNFRDSSNTRKWLVDKLLFGEFKRLIDAISNYLSEQTGKRFDFFALLRDPNGQLSMPKEALPFTEYIRDALDVQGITHSQTYTSEAIESFNDKVLLNNFTYQTISLFDSGLAQSREEREGWKFKQNLPGEITLEMVRVEGRSYFVAESLEELEDTSKYSNVKKITIPNFYIGMHAVTQVQWRAVAKLSKVSIELPLDPSFNSDENAEGEQNKLRPVENITWEQAVEFCARLSKHSRRIYRLPTEAEWEYACRSGTNTAYAFGSTISREYVNYLEKEKHSSSRPEDYKSLTIPVGSRKFANQWGLYDMHGNVREWCENHINSYFGALQKNEVTTVEMPKEYLLKGGAWNSDENDCRSDSRYFQRSGDRTDGNGFRVIVSEQCNSHPYYVSIITKPKQAKTKSVFISYSIKDRIIAANVKSTLEQAGITVAVDMESMNPGKDIGSFIDQAIRKADVMLCIISKNSLASDWVAFESVESFAAEKHGKDKKFIACYIDDGFLTKEDFTIKALAAINKQIEEFETEVERVKLQGIESPINLTSIIQRKIKLKNNLSEIILRLRDSLTLDIREPEFETSMKRIIAEILALDPFDVFRKKYLRAFEQRFKNDSHKLDERFVQLTLMIDKGESEAQRWERQSLGSIAEIIKLNEAQYPAMVILGAPGSGKSTILRRLELDYHRQQIGAGGGRLSFFVSLNRYKYESLDRKVTPQEFLESEWKTAYEETGRSLESLLKEGRVLLLLDAVNEMPHSDQDQYHQLMDVWRQFTVDQVERGNRILFSCRSLDYSLPLSTPDLRVHNVELQPLTAEKIGEFLQVYLPKEGSEVFAQIKQNGTLDFYSNPYFLRLLCDQIGEDGEVPKGRASLFTRYVRAAIRREMDTDLFVNEDWLSRHDRQKLVYNKWANAYQLPVAGALLERLGHLAYEMQRSGQRKENKQVSIGLEQAMGLIGSTNPEKMIKGGVAISVLDQDIATDEVKYHQQLLQEYFAARRLAEEPKPEMVSVEWRASEVRPSLAETIASLANGDPLPPPGMTGWEETTLVALPMSGDPEGYVARLMEQNLPLAARCAVSPEVAISEELKSRIREGLIVRTQEMKADLRARIAAGEALGLIGDPRFKRYRGSAGECLLPPLVEIPAGSYPIGDDQSGYEDERPAHQVELAAFRIGVFPVTNGEYAQFIAAGGYEHERWWDTLAALSWLREGGAEGQKQSYRDARLNWQRNWTDGQIRAMVQQKRATEQQVEFILWMRNSSDEEFEQQIEEQVPAGTLYRQPGFWEDATYNNPAQPVVGVSWYEARAYCNWLSFVTGEGYRLPTEVEFEAAARGSEGRRYSYGNEFDETRCNTFESHIRRTTPVGIFANATPEGAFDLTGNAYTWTSTIFDQERFAYPWQPDQRENPGDAGSRRLVRGGSWFNNQGVARAACRNDSHPAYRSYYNGFRVVCVVRPPSLKL